MKKLFVCDFDGTIYNKDNMRHFNQVLQEIANLESKGDKVIVATGRPLHILKPFFDDFDNRYFISNDGALFTKGFDVIIKQPIDVKAVLDLKCPRNTNFFAYGHSITYAKFTDVNTGIKLRKFFLNHMVRVDCIKEIKEDIYKICFFGKKVKTDTLDLSWNSCGVTEYTGKGVNKGSCLEKVLELPEFKGYEVVVVGDGINDISMMRLADKSYAMISAPPIVKGSCGAVVDDILKILRGDAR